ncbi:heme-binding protein [Sinorhizobium fredii]|uniref:heme-binding protein n=1 Tax=Rhizobium fredii TaxID=380 RepID=UPI0004B9FCE9|nr:heme-binding protein [Sinorhizobium fredii]
MVFGEGVPIQVEGRTIGAIGVSGGTVAEDIAIAERLGSLLVISGERLPRAWHSRSVIKPTIAALRRLDNQSTVSRVLRVGLSREKENEWS